MKKINVCFLISMLLLSLLTNAQNRCSIRLSMGTADFSNGYHITVSGGIPIVKSLELSPSFSYANTLPIDYINNSAFSDFHSSYYVSWSVPDPDMELSNYGYSLGAFDLNLIFKPFELLHNNLSDKHELFLGAGYGFKHYIQSRIYYDDWGGSMVLQSFGYKINSGFTPSFSLGYNYKIGDKCSIGVKGELIGFDGEFATLLGVQTGYFF